MPLNVISDSQIAPGQPVSLALLAQIRDNIVEGRENGISGTPRILHAYSTPLIMPANTEIEIPVIDDVNNYRAILIEYYHNLTGTGANAGSRVAIWIAGLTIDLAIWRLGTDVDLSDYMTLRRIDSRRLGATTVSGQIHLSAVLGEV